MTLNKTSIKFLGSDFLTTPTGIELWAKSVEITLANGVKVEVGRPRVSTMLKKISPLCVNLCEFVKTYFSELQIDTERDNREVINDLLEQARLVEIVASIATEYPHQFNTYVKTNLIPRKSLLSRLFGG